MARHVEATTTIEPITVGQKVGATFGPFPRSQLGAPTTMIRASLLLAGVAAAVHLTFFLAESVLFMREPVYRRFGTETVADARAQRVFELHQDFYNHFLGIGAAIGIALAVGNPVGVRWALLAFCCGSMTAAAVVLAVSKPDLVRASGVQGARPLLALVLLVAA